MLLCVTTTQPQFIPTPQDHHISGEFWWAKWSLPSLNVIYGHIRSVPFFAHDFLEKWDRAVWSRVDVDLHVLISIIQFETLTSRQVKWPNLTQRSMKVVSYISAVSPEQDKCNKALHIALTWSCQELFTLTFSWPVECNGSIWYVDVSLESAILICTYIWLHSCLCSDKTRNMIKDRFKRERSVIFVPQLLHTPASLVEELAFAFGSFTFLYQLWRDMMWYGTLEFCE